MLFKIIVEICEWALYFFSAAGKGGKGTKRSTVAITPGLFNKKVNVQIPGQTSYCIWLYVYIYMALSFYSSYIYLKINLKNNKDKKYSIKC